MIERVLPALALLTLPLAVRLVRPAEPPLLAASGPPLAEMAAERDLVELLPPGALVVLDGPGLAALATRGLDDPLVEAVLAGGVDDLLLAGTGADAAELLARADAALGSPILPTLSALTQEGAALGVELGLGGPAWTLALRGADHDAALRALLDAFAGIEAVNDLPAGLIDGGRRELRGAETWKLGDDVAIGLHGAVVMIASSQRGLEGALARLDDPGERPDVAAAFPAKNGATVLRAALDVERIDALASLGDREGMDKLRAMPRDPGVQLLLGPAIAELGSAEALGLALDLDGTSLRLRASARGTEDCGGLSVRTGAGAPAPLAPNPRDVAQALVYRDLAAAFRERADRFPADAIPAFAKAETDLALFFGGLDLAREVLPGISPWARIVVREVDFAPARRPDNPLPAAAIVLALDGSAGAGDESGPALATAFQTLISIVNLERAQERRPGFLLSLEQLGERTLTFAALPIPRAGEGVDIDYNLEPACVQVDGLFVLATHAALARELARELAVELANEVAPRAETSEHLRIDGEAIARLVAQNRETLVARNALEKGHSLEAARREVAGLERLLALARDVRVQVASQAAGASASERSVELTLELDVAAAAAVEGQAEIGRTR